MQLHSPKAGIAALVALMLLAACTSQSRAATKAATPATTGSRDTRRSIKFAVTTPAPVPLTPICDAANTCLTPVNGPVFTVTGDAQGSGVNSGAAFLTSNDSALSTALATFSGTVSQCGSGTVLLRYTARYGAKVPGGGEGDWDYVEGTGTGDLAHINGGGTFRLSSTNEDLSATAAFSGRIRC